MIIKTVDIGCDWPDCDAIGENDAFDQTAAGARANARDKGWGRRHLPRGDVDLCPLHFRLVQDNPSALRDALEEAS